MQPKDARSMLHDALKNVDFIALAGVIDALADDYRWGMYHNSIWRPNYKKVEEDLPWLVDNWGKLCEAMQVLKDTKE